MLKLRNIDFSIGGARILNDVSFDAPKGEVTVLLGPSGAGKTTLLRCINALETPSGGKIILAGKEYDAKKLSKAEVADLRKRVSMVFQHYPLFHNKTVLDNIAEGLKLVHGYDRDRAKDVAIESLRQFRVEDKADSYPAQLSGGQKQRVSIARAISSGPSVILFDEPTSALDFELVCEVENVVKNLAAKGITVIIVTHELGFAKNVADNIALMEGGRIADTGSPSELFSYSQLQVFSFLEKEKYHE
jgi:L-cystine transport system ATP-binding protein